MNAKPEELNPTSTPNASESSSSGSSSIAPSPDPESLALFCQGDPEVMTPDQIRAEVQRIRTLRMSSQTFRATVEEEVELILGTEEKQKRTKKPAQPKVDLSEWS